MQILQFVAEHWHSWEALKEEKVEQLVHYAEDEQVLQFGSAQE